MSVRKFTPAAAGADEDRGRQEGKLMATKTSTIQDALLNGGELLPGGSWSDRWIGKNKIERTGTFDVEGAEDCTGVEFRAVITLGKTQTSKTA